MGEKTRVKSQKIGKGSILRINKGVRTCGIYYRQVLRTLDCRPPQIILTFIHSWGNWRITSCHNSSKEHNPAGHLRVALSLASNGMISILCPHAYIVRKKSLKILDETTDTFLMRMRPQTLSISSSLNLKAKLFSSPTL